MNLYLYERGNVMKAPKEDRRIRKTRKLFEVAFLELLKTKDINKISVKDLADMVDMNRGTFYIHYTDVYDLLDSVENNLVSDLSNITEWENSNIFEGFERNKFTKIVQALEYIKDNKQIFKTLLSSKGNILFLEKIKKLFEEKFLDEMFIISQDINKQYYENVTLFFISGAIGLIQEWLKNDTALPPMELATVIENIMVKGISSLDNQLK